MGVRFYVRNSIRVACWGLLALPFFCDWAYAQQSQDVFGKRRIQYQQFNRQYISSTNFDIYYYQGGEEIARNAIVFAEAEFERITELLGFSPYAKIKLYIYNSQADLRQSNVGLDDENSVTGGKTNFVKNIIEIPFTGNQVDFRKEICHGMARTLIFSMMYGGSLKDVVQNSYLLTLPEWFTGGAALYVAEGWSLEMDDYMRDALLNNRVKRPGNLTNHEADVVGQSIWNFIAEKYGKSNISNILNLTRILRNEESGIGSTLGINWDRLLRDWRNYYYSMAETAEESYTMPPANLRMRRFNFRNLIYNEVRLSASGNLAAYSTNNQGRYRIFVEPLGGGPRKVIYRGGNRVLTQRIDYSEPHIAFQGDEEVHAVFSRRGKNTLYSYNLSTGKHTYSLLPNFEQVTGFDVSPDGKYFVFSAEKDGGNDLFLFSLNTGKTSRLTHDLFDDLDPRFAGNNNRIIFSSNRLSDTLHSAKSLQREIYDNNNVFLLKSGSNVLTRLSNTLHNERSPQWHNDSTVTWLSDDKGIVNLEKTNPANGRTVALTDYRQNIVAADVNLEKHLLLARMHSNGKEYLYALPLDTERELNSVPTRRQELMDEQLKRLLGHTMTLRSPIAPDSSHKIRHSETAHIPSSGAGTDTLGKDDINIRNYVFETEKVKKPKQVPVYAPSPPVAGASQAAPLSGGNTGADNTIRPKTIKQSKKDQMSLLGVTGPFPYKNRMSMDNVVTTPYFDQLLGFGLTMGTGITDMFENHKLNANAFISTDLRSSKMDFKYVYLTRRFDFNVGFTKNSYFVQQSADENKRYNLGRLEAGVSYPLNIFSNINLTPFYSRTREAGLGYTVGVLQEPDIYRHYMGFKTEFVFDNTLAHGLNIIEGTRLKLKLEQTYGMNDPAHDFGNIMVDLRHYQKISREIVVALRGSAGRFFGPAAKKYMIGGMDNWVTQTTNVTTIADDPLNLSNTSPDAGTDKLFNQYVTNMRGFQYNTLYGQSYMLFNAELRIPVVRYFYRGPISSNFLKNLQFVAFTDAGTAFTGSSPFSTDNSYNTRTIGAGTNDVFSPWKITVTNYRNPFLVSYGAGVRTVALGYFLKIDLAQGIKDYNNTTPRWYITLGYDF